MISMNNVEIMSLGSSIIAVFIISIIGYFDYKNQMYRYLRNLAGGRDWGFDFQYWIYLLCFLIVICLNSFFFWFSELKPSPCRSEKEIIIEYLDQDVKKLKGIKE